MPRIQTMEELIQILEKHPEWRQWLLHVLLTDEFLQWPSQMEHLEALMVRLIEQVQALAEGERQLQSRADQLTAHVNESTVRMNELTGHVSQLTMRAIDMETPQKGMLDDLGYLKGRDPGAILS